MPCWKPFHGQNATACPPESQPTCQAGPGRSRAAVELGFVGVFAGASKTPLACSLLAIEVFGGAHAGLFAVACFVSYSCSGAGGIYKAQR